MSVSIFKVWIDTCVSNFEIRNRKPKIFDFLNVKVTFYALDFTDA